MCKESYAQVVEANVQETDDKLRGEAVRLSREEV